jgi:hypothetical protein
MNTSPEHFGVSQQAAKVLEALGIDAAEYFARHLSGDWGSVTPEVRQLNQGDSPPYRLSCFWLEGSAHCLAVVSYADHCWIITSDELSEDVGYRPH